MFDKCDYKHVLTGIIACVIKGHEIAVMTVRVPLPSQLFSALTSMEEPAPSKSPNPRLDILLLSTYLDGRQHSASKSHPEEQTLDLFVDISTLLAVGNKHNPRAENVNAVMGTVRLDVQSPTVEVLVCTENNSQNNKQDIKKVGPWKRAMDKGLGLNADKVGDLDGISPRWIEGRVALNKWDGDALVDDDVDTPKYVISLFNSNILSNNAPVILPSTNIFNISLMSLLLSIAMIRVIFIASNALSITALIENLLPGCSISPHAGAVRRLISFQRTWTTR